MSLSPHAHPFFSCFSSNNTYVCERERFLRQARSSLSYYDFILYCDILNEWESTPLLANLLEQWELCKCDDSTLSLNAFQVLSFNVRGLELRQQEVLLLANSFNPEVLILLETGVFDLPFCVRVFSSYQVFYQEGENPHGGVVVMICNSLKCERVEWKLPNVCVVDILGERSTGKKLRICGVYAPESRTWQWDDLSKAITSNCVVCGDFNVDLEEDSTKSDELSSWADSVALSPYLPKNHASLRSNRTIDYAFTSGRAIDIQTLEGKTTSDHKPLISTIPTSARDTMTARNTHWKVFSLFCEFVLPFWKKLWNLARLDSLCEDYTTFLSLLIGRCTVSFPARRYRAPIPPDLRAYMSCTRALSFRQKRTGDLHLKYIVTVRRREARKTLKDFLSEQWKHATTDLHPSTRTTTFWSKTRSHMKPISSSVQGFLQADGKVTRDAEAMTEEAANYYEEFFQEAEVYRPHPYTDGPNQDHYWGNYMEEIPPANHWPLMMEIFNLSFSEGRMPRRWNDSRMLITHREDWRYLRP